MKKQAFYSSAAAIGDLICATPTIKKLAIILNSPITVISKHPNVFKNLPYVYESLNFDNYTEEQLSEKYDLHKSFFMLGRKDSQGIEFKHAMCDIRQFHAKDLGFLLTPEELTCDYKPDDDLNNIQLPDKYIVIHPAQSWDSRTWSKSNWQNLCDSLANIGIPVISIGKDDKESGFNSISKPVFKLNIKNGIDLTNKTTLDQSWYILNKSICVVTMDSGVLHLAGTTNTYIVQLGSSIKPEYRAPYRNGSQGYKYSYVPGECKLHCASDLKYSLRDWESIQSVTLIATCLEKKPTFECNPASPMVTEVIKKVWANHKDENKTISKPISKPKTLVIIESNSLGDTIGSMAIINKWKNGIDKDVSILCKFSEYFKNSYPNLNLLDKSKNVVSYSVEDGIWKVNDSDIYTDKISARYKFEVPLIDGYAQDFGIKSDGVELKIDYVEKERPIKNKYVCIGIQSTAQCKYWNYPGGWDELCKKFRKKGLTPVCIDKDFSYGIHGYVNQTPGSSVNRTGLSIEDTLNYLYHCEMFIGLSSGLSWLAQAIQKPTVIISNFTSKDHEYIDERTLRIYDEDICHGCFHKYPFDKSDWLWCPVFRNDENRRFICSKAITPEDVMRKIEEKYGI